MTLRLLCRGPLNGCKCLEFPTPVGPFLPSAFCRLLSHPKPNVGRPKPQITAISAEASSIVCLPCNVQGDFNMAGVESKDEWIRRFELQEVHRRNDGSRIFMGQAMVPNLQASPRSMDATRYFYRAMSLEEARHWLGCATSASISRTSGQPWGNNMQYSKATSPSLVTATRSFSRWTTACGSRR